MYFTFLPKQNSTQSYLSLATNRALIILRPQIFSHIGTIHGLTNYGLSDPYDTASVTVGL